MGGQRFLDSYDVYTEAGEKGIASDTSITALANASLLDIVPSKEEWIQVGMYKQPAKPKDKVLQF